MTQQKRHLTTMCVPKKNPQNKQKRNPQTNICIISALFQCTKNVLALKMFTHTMPLSAKCSLACARSLTQPFSLTLPGPYSSFRTHLSLSYVSQAHSCIVHSSYPLLKHSALDLGGISHTFTNLCNTSLSPIDLNLFGARVSFKVHHYTQNTAGKERDFPYPSRFSWLA